ncbi:hypothetical protein OEG84_13965 [Hoeflea sp. G2-23]|uniref:Transposase n=1 Tax=Hoeflea algicola TaxID=2983763 RepID=A0ABT3ZAV7_9HYPH|nr:hypothetical protein [Hoeflea algicola]MCY0148773.1 hypothetical protein [Hoeflea algicola]
MMPVEIAFGPRLPHKREKIESERTNGMGKPRAYGLGIVLVMVLGFQELQNWVHVHGFLRWQLIARAPAEIGDACESNHVLETIVTRNLAHIATLHCVLRKSRADPPFRHAS